jgi:hypothetical protein
VGEPSAPEPPRQPELAEDETIINPYYMRQLLQYGIRLGQQQNSADMNPEDLLREATVRLSASQYLLDFLTTGVYQTNSGWSRSSRRSHETQRRRCEMDATEQTHLLVFLARVPFTPSHPGHFVRCMPKKTHMFVHFIMQRALLNRMHAPLPLYSIYHPKYHPHTPSL